jgi:hypothetical protein
LTQAARTSATLLLQPKAETQSPFTVVLRETRMDALIVEPESRAAEPPPPTGCMDATLFLDRQEYLFSTHLLETISIEQRTFLVLARPVEMQTWQRRRFMRAELAQSSTLHLTPVRPEGVDTNSLTGAVLNISPDGVACRLAIREADPVAVGETLDTRFELCGESDPFILRGTLRSKTPGGSEDSMILGIQFETRGNPVEEFDRLSRALRAYY